MKNLPLAAYHLLVTLACADREIVYQELDVLQSFVKSDDFEINFNPEDQYDLVCDSSFSKRQEIFEKATAFISKHGSENFKSLIYEYAKDLVSADDVVKQSEFDMILKIADSWDLMDEGFEFDVPIEWDEETLAAMKFCDELNAEEEKKLDIHEANEEVISSIGLQFKYNGMTLHHIIDFEDPRIDYSNASPALRSEMLHIRNVAQSKLPNILMRDFSEIKNNSGWRYCFEYENQMYFVLFDVETQPSLKYIGCENWDFFLQ